MLSMKTSCRRQHNRMQYQLGPPLLCAVTIVLTSCNLDDPAGPPLEEMFSLRLSPTSIPADGVHRGVVTIGLKGDTPTGLEVMLVTDRGRFASVGPSDEPTSPSELTVKLGARSQDVAFVSGIESGIATVRATISGFTLFQDVSFTPAPPQRLELYANRTVASANGTDRVELTASLSLAGEGTVTKRTRVVFQARDPLSHDPVPETRHADSDETGLAAITLTRETAGQIEFVAYAENAPDVRDSLIITFQ